MTNRMRRFSVPAASNVAAISGLPGAIGHAQSQMPSASPAGSGLSQIYAIARQQAIATVQERRWNLLLRQLLESDE
jgi:hypothetical protein